MSRPGVGDDVLRTVAQTVSQQLPQDIEWMPEHVDAPLNDIGFDSLRTVRLLVQLESDLGIEFPPNLINAETFRTVRTIASAARTVGTAEQIG